MLTYHQIFQIIDAVVPSELNGEHIRQASIVYGPSMTGFRSNIRLDFTLDSTIRRLPWDLMTIIDETFTEDYLVFLRSPNEFLNSDHINRILQMNFNSGCFVSYQVVRLFFNLFSRNTVMDHSYSEVI